MRTLFNVSTYTTSLNALVSGSTAFAGKATDYAPEALVGLRSGDIDADAILLDMCKATGSLSSKGKANGQALVNNGHEALYRVQRGLAEVEKALADVRTADAVAAIVDGFAGYLPDYDGVSPDPLPEGADVEAVKEYRKAMAAYRRGFAAEIKARFPNAPTSWADCLRQVRKAVNAASRADAPADEANELTAGQSIAFWANELVAKIAKADVDALIEADEALVALMAAIKAGAERVDADCQAEADAAKRTGTEG